jgi:hypothetical protein
MAQLLVRVEIGARTILRPPEEVLPLLELGAPTAEVEGVRFLLAITQDQREDQREEAVTQNQYQSAPLLTHTLNSIVWLAVLFFKTSLTTLELEAEEPYLFQWVKMEEMA